MNVVADLPSNALAAVSSAAPPKFKAANYTMWKMRMLAYLDARGLKEVTVDPITMLAPADRSRRSGNFALKLDDVNVGGVDEDDAADAADDEEAKKKTKKKDAAAVKRKRLLQLSKVAYALLVQALDDEDLMLIAGCSEGDANAVWVLLEERAAKSGSTTMRVDKLYRSLYKMRLDKKKDGSYESVRNYYARMVTIVTQLRALGETIDDEKQKNIFVNGIPKKKPYELTRKLITRESDELSLEEMVAAFDEDDVSDNADDDDDDDSRKKVIDAGYAAGEKKGRRCFRCGKDDHMRKDCKNDLKCFSCNGEGHISKDCPKKNDADDIKCFECGGRGHVANECVTRLKKENARVAIEKTNLIHIICDGCKVDPINGWRYRCIRCGVFDYCESCYRDVGKMHQCDGGQPEWKREYMDRWIIQKH